MNTNHELENAKRRRNIRPCRPRRPVGARWAITRRHSARFNWRRYGQDLNKFTVYEPFPKRLPTFLMSCHVKQRSPIPPGFRISRASSGSWNSLVHRWPYLCSFRLQRAWQRASLLCVFLPALQSEPIAGLATVGLTFVPAYPINGVSRTRRFHHLLAFNRSWNRSWQQQILWTDGASRSPSMNRWNASFGMPSCELWMRKQAPGQMEGATVWRTCFASAQERGSSVPPKAITIGKWLGTSSGWLRKCCVRFRPGAGSNYPSRLLRRPKGRTGTMNWVLPVQTGVRGPLTLILETGADLPARPSLARASHRPWAPTVSPASSRDEMRPGRGRRRPLARGLSVVFRQRSTRLSRPDRAERRQTGLRVPSQ